MMQQTSLDAYESIIPVLGLKQKMVYDIILVFQPVSDGEIARRTGIPRALVAARRGELEKQGLIVPGVEQIDPMTKRRVCTWQTKNYVGGNNE